MKKIRRVWQPRLARPLVYMLFGRFGMSLCLVLIADFFLSPLRDRPLRGTLCLLAGLIFAALGWIAWLRLDGVALPKPLMLRFNPRKKPERGYGDIIDYVDEQPPVTFEDLEDDEKDLCILGADLFCFIAFLILSLVL